MKTNPTLNNKLVFQHYLVAFLDLVGQRDALRRLLAIPATPTEERVFIENTRQSLGKVLELRRDFEGFFEGASRVPDLSRYPVEYRDTIQSTMKIEYTMLGMSDAIVIAVPLGGDDEFCKAMNGVELAFRSICGLAIDAFSVGLIFRAGLDVGIATHLEETNEIYGSALVNAYHIETELAEYPRFVVGSGLLDFIQTVQNQKPQTIFGQVAKFVANACRRMIVQDTDGRQMLDFLGAEVKLTLGGVISAERVLRGHDFVHDEYERFRVAGNEKLASRYFRLLQYYLARKKVWGL
jgi:hypothetical protein